MDYNEKCPKCDEAVVYEATSAFGRVMMHKGTNQPHMEICQGGAMPVKKQQSRYAYKGARKDRQAKKHKVLEPARLARRRAEGAAV